MYRPSNNATQLNGYSWKIQYGDGSSAGGNVYKDVVAVGGVTAQRQAVEAAKHVSQQFIQDTANDGIMGLGFSSANQGECLPTEIASIILTLPSPPPAAAHLLRHRQEPAGQAGVRCESEA